MSTTAEQECERLRRMVSELATVLLDCEAEMSAAYRLGLVDSLTPKGEHSSFTLAIGNARIALVHAEPYTNLNAIKRRHHEHNHERDYRPDG